MTIKQVLTQHITESSVIKGRFFDAARRLGLHRSFPWNDRNSTESVFSLICGFLEFAREFVEKTGANVAERQDFEKLASYRILFESTCLEKLHLDRSDELFSAFHESSREMTRIAKRLSRLGLTRDDAVGDQLLNDFWELDRSFHRRIFGASDDIELDENLETLARQFRELAAPADASEALAIADEHECVVSALSDFSNPAVLEKNILFEVLSRHVRNAQARWIRNARRTSSENGVDARDLDSSSTSPVDNVNRFSADKHFFDMVDRLIEKYPRKWVGVANDGVVFVGTSPDKIAAEAARRGLDAGSFTTRWVDPDFFTAGDGYFRNLPDPE